MKPGWAMLLLLSALVGCSGAVRTVRLDTGQDKPLVFTPRTGKVDPVKLDEDAFQKTVAQLARDVRPSAHPMEDARRLFGAPAHSGTYLYETKSRRLTALGTQGALAAEPPREDVELTRAYLRWCERKQRPGDCLRILAGGATLNGDGKYALAMALAMDSVWDETAQALGQMVDRDAVLSTLISAATVYLMLWVLPEPASKGLAATMTLGLMGYLGYETFWSLLGGWVRLVEEVDRATTFDEVRAAGERYGATLGRNAASIFVMLATAAVGHTGSQLAATLPHLPGAAQAAVVAEVEVGVLYGSAAAVQSVAVTAEGITLALAPGAVAMTARATSGEATGVRAWQSYSGFLKAMGKAGKGKQWHHIVEQTPGNIERFGAESIQNTENIIAIDETIHRRISGLYSSIRSYSRGMTVRKWLSSQSLQAQREFGLGILRDFGIVL